MIEVDIAMVRMDTEVKISMAPIVVLREKKGEPRRLLPIWVGIFEALAIITELEENPVRMNRPFTHDLLKSVIEELGAKVISILVSDLKAGTFYAEITLALENGDALKIDSRPSDAMALALRAKAPIYVAEAVMDSTGINPEIVKAGNDEELKAVLENLSPEDLYKV